MSDERVEKVQDSCTYCACAAFPQLVEARLIKHSPWQVLKDGELVRTSYYHLGPNGPKGYILPCCPACGGKIRHNEEFLALVTKPREPEDHAAPA